MTTRRAGSVICNITISADGYVAGSHQTEQRPFGDDCGDGFGDKLHAWMFESTEENRAEVDVLAAYSAVIMGRNMFGPVRGEWDRRWHVIPVLLGQGRRLFDNLAAEHIELELVRQLTPDVEKLAQHVTHLRYRVLGPPATSRSS